MDSPATRIDNIRRLNQQREGISYSKFSNNCRNGKSYDTKHYNQKKGQVKLFVKNRFEIHIRYKDKLHKAAVRKDGSIFYKGIGYNSPSTAAQAITNRAMNGWATWFYERARAIGQGS